MVMIMMKQDNNGDDNDDSNGNSDNSNVMWCCSIQKTADENPTIKKLIL